MRVRSVWRPWLVIVVLFGLSALLVVPSAAVAAEPGDAQERVNGEPPIELTSIINGIQIGFAKEYGKTTIWLRICADSPNFQLRSESVGRWSTEIFHRTDASGGCSPSPSSWWRMVYNADPNTDEVFRIYGTANDAVLDETAFMQRAARAECRVTSYGGGVCTPSTTPSPASVPNASIEEPDEGQTLSGTINVSGVVLDAGSWNGTSIDQVQIFNGTTLLGTANYGIARPDVATSYGDARFTNAGFNYQLDTTRLTNGDITLTVRYRSSISGQESSITRAVKIDNTSPDTTLPNGEITAPAENTQVGTTISVSATAIDNEGGSGVNRVEFYLAYNGKWNLIGAPSSSPYQVTYTLPVDLQSQGLILTIHVIDNAGNRRIDAGGYRRVTFIASQHTPNVKENWLPVEQRAYLNQRSLSDAISDGDVKCGAASMAMLLAMNGKISKDYNSMAAKAKEMYPHTLVGEVAFLYRMRAELSRQGLVAREHNLNTSAAWQLIKQEVDAGRPVLVRTAHGVVTPAGHLFVAVGYVEENGMRQLITYDPFGRWLGSCCTNNYDWNSRESGSAKGRWVHYNFDRLFGSANWLITARNPTLQATLADTLSPPDEISVEEESISTFNGSTDNTGALLYLPLLRR
ncbi:hypothetical protein HC891_22060 [Candidatus Gracilibacteria bacterium]|nr:hypothetical protein [Candidatus Gracilibacteria bacterium]